jgi:hypothetical protein
MIVVKSVVALLLACLLVLGAVSGHQTPFHHIPTLTEKYRDNNSNSRHYVGIPKYQHKAAIFASLPNHAYKMHTALQNGAHIVEANPGHVKRIGSKAAAVIGGAAASAAKNNSEQQNKKLEISASTNGKQALSTVLTGNKYVTSENHAATTGHKTTADRMRDQEAKITQLQQQFQHYKKNN